MPEFSLETKRRTHVVEITDQVRAALGDTGGAVAACIYVPHTSGGIVIQEYADAAVGRDLEMALERIVDDGWPWEHIEEGDVNPWSHVRAALTATSVVIPLAEGELALGTWQGIFFCDFDGPRTRRVIVTPLS